MASGWENDPRLARTPVIDVPITATNMDDVLTFIEEHIQEVKGEYICVSNAHTTVMAHDDPDYYRVQTESLMSVPDGKPLSVVGGKAVPTMGRVTDLILCARSSRCPRSTGIGITSMATLRTTSKPWLSLLSEIIRVLKFVGMSLPCSGT